MESIIFPKNLLHSVAFWDAKEPVLCCRRIPNHIGAICFAFTMIFNILLQAPRFFELTMEKAEVSSLREDPYFVIMTLSVTVIFNNLGPLLLMIFLHVSLYRALEKRSRRQLERQSARKVGIINPLISRK